MDLVAVRLVAGPEARNRLLSPETVVDVLWASALPGDRLEHIRARHGPAPGTVDAILFHLSADPDTGSVRDSGAVRDFEPDPATDRDPPESDPESDHESDPGFSTGFPMGTPAGHPGMSTADTALGLCRRALRGAPSLSGWSVTLLGPTDMNSWILA